MIVNISGYTLYMKTSVENPRRIDWVTTSLCENPRFYSPKKRVPNLRVLIVISDVILVLDFSAHAVLIGD